MRAGVAFALAALGVEANDAIKGVVIQLENMLQRSEAESKSTAELYDKTACNCRADMRQFTFEFETAQKDKDALNLKKTDLEGQSARLGHTISKHLGVLAEVKEAVKAKQAEKSADATTMGQKQKEEADGAELAELETINQPYLRSELTRLTGEIDELEKERDMRVKKCEEMIDACNKALKMLAGTQGKTIINMVKDLKKQANEKKKSIMTGENEVQKQIYDKQQEKSQKQTRMQISKEVSDKLEANKAGVDAELADTKTRLGERSAELLQLQDDIDETKTSCEEAATAYDAASKMLIDEVAGLTKAIESLKTVPGVMEPADFLQVRSHSNKPEDASASSAVSFLAQRASLTHSPILSALALKMKVKADPVDYFASIRQMIVDMVARLEEEQAAETSKTDWCGESLKAMSNDKSDKTDDLDAAISAVKAAEAKIVSLKKEMQENEDSKAEAEKLKEEATETKEEAYELYTAMETEKRQALKGLDGAITVLEEVFAGDAGTERSGAASSSTAQRSNTGQGIIDLLKKIKGDEKNDFAKATMEVQCYAADSYAMESEAPSDCKAGGSEITEQKNIIDAKTREIDTLIGLIDTNKSDISSTKETLVLNKEDKAAKTGLLETSVKTLKARQAACVNAGDSFEARKKRRAEEMSALKEALTILEEHSANSEVSGASPGTGFLQLRSV